MRNIYQCTACANFEPCKIVQPDHLPDPGCCPSFMGCPRWTLIGHDPPLYHGDGVPCCSDDGCGEYDGKRCKMMGCRPDTICEPAVKKLAKDSKRLKKARKTRIVFAKPPGPDSEFVEVENASGKSINVGNWKQEGDLWVLTLDNL